MEWYEGTADAVFQNLDILERYPAEHIVVLAGDHVYKMDYGRMLEQHVETGADVTVGCVEVPCEEAVAFGVMRVDEQDRIAKLHREAERSARHAGQARPRAGLMGIYVFNTRFLYDELRRDAADPHSQHDFGRDIIPYIVQHGKAQAHRFSDSCVKSSARGRGLLAGRGHAGCLLRGQSRPHARGAGARPL